VTAKGAVLALTKQLAVELGPLGITVNAISPGARTRVNAELLDAGFRDRSSRRLDLAPEHVAAVVAYLASPAASDITGRVEHVAGGEIREYRTERTARSELVDRLVLAVEESSS
jgi:NAD(P)-dependent dehydrogenase (short-subunit alcohol dehydrogenase family)